MTASHCICNPPADVDPARSPDNDYSVAFTTCIGADSSEPQPTVKLNQHVPLKDNEEVPIEENEVENMYKRKERVKSKSFNLVTVRIGSRDFKNGVKQKVESAFVMYTDKYFVWENFDIGLIIVEKEMTWNGNYPELHIAPLCLPSR